MILNTEKFLSLVQGKVTAYVEITTNKFFELNPTLPKCQLSSEGQKLYDMVSQNVQFKEGEFSKEVQNEVEKFIECLNNQLQKVIDQEARPVDLTFEEIFKTVGFTEDEIKSCCMSTEEVYELIKDNK